jgi:hypothetical protein
MEDCVVRQETWPNVLMLCGFVAAAVFLGLLLFANLSPSLKVVASIAESISIGIGSIGLGGRIAQARRK